MVSAAAFFAPGARLRVAFAAPSAVFAAFDAFDAFAAGFSATRAGFVRPGMLAAAAFAAARVRGVVAHVHERHGVRFECAAVGYADGQRGSSTGNVRERDGCGVRRDVRGGSDAIDVLRNHDSSRRKIVVPLFRAASGASDGLTTV